MRDFINGIMRSKTIIFALALAALGVVEQNLRILQPLMNSDTFAIFSVIIGAIVAMLRIVTTQSLISKGGNVPQQGDNNDIRNP